MSFLYALCHCERWHATDLARLFVRSCDRAHQLPLTQRPASPALHLREEKHQVLFCQMEHHRSSRQPASLSEAQDSFKEKEQGATGQFSWSDSQIHWEMRISFANQPSLQKKPGSATLHLTYSEQLKRVANCQKLVANSACKVDAYESHKCLGNWHIKEHWTVSWCNAK